MLYIERLEIKGITAERLTIKPGDCISLSGASGMGKSLFLKGVADLMINRGTLSIHGESRETMKATNWRRRVTYVGAKTAWWHEKVIDHFKDKEWLEAVVAEVDLSPKVIDWNVSRLSSGEAQRLALLRALEGTYEDEVRYFLLDEPTSALDGGRQSMVEALFNRFLNANQIGILFVSHDERQVERFARRHWQIYDRHVREIS